MPTQPTRDDLPPYRRPLQAIGAGTDDSPRLLVETWLAVARPDGWRVLLLRRVPARGGFWQGVSGRVESEDSTLEAAARREIREELGLEDEVELFDLDLTFVFTSPLSGIVYGKRTFGAALSAGTADRIVLSDEHDAAEVVTFAEARARVRWPENRGELERLEALLGSR